MRRLAWRDGRAALVALVVAGGVLRFATLGTQSFWNDEALTVLTVGDGLDGLLDGVLHREANPPFYFALAWVWTRAAGTGEVGLRSLSALIGTLTIPVAFAIGARLGGRSAGLVTAALVAFNPFLVWFSQEARAYALLVLLTSVATLYWLRAMNDSDRRAPVMWGMAGGLALLAHYFAAFALIPQAALLLWRARAPRAAVLRGIAIVGAAAVILAPLVLAQRDARVDWVGGRALRERVLDVPKHWIAGPFGNPVDVAVAVAALLLAGGGVAVARLPREQARPSLLLAAVALAGAALPLVLAATGADYVVDRYIVASLVPLLAVAANGLASCRGGHVAAVTLSCLGIAFTATWIADPELHREDWRAASRRLSSVEDQTAVVTSSSGDITIPVYLLTAHRAVDPVSVRSVAYVAPWRFGQPRPPSPPAPGPEFRIVSRADLPTMTLVQFRAARETELTLASLEAHAMSAGPRFVLVTR
jgi:4-amino-4-deoxy-L-arabinose transferase-like glycosyltransferase